MQLIQELPLAQQIATGAAVVLLLVLLFVAVRRRGAATRAAAPAAPAAPSRKDLKAEKKAAKSNVPRRKRRKLAAEAAHAMGAQVPQGDIVVPPVEIPVATPAAAEFAVEPVTPAEVPMPATPAIDDPYVTDAEAAPAYPAVAAADVVEYDEDGVVVADPGWPAPGELASSFDPDAFDPLPGHDDYPPAESPYAAVPAEDDDDFVEPIELPELALEEIELPNLTPPVPAPAGYETYDDDDFDPASGWSDGETEVIPFEEVAEWDETPVAAPAAPVAAETGDPEALVDLEQFWGEPDGDEWDDTPPVEVHEAASVAAEAPSQIEATAEIAPVEDVLASWNDEPEVPWNEAETAAVFEDLTVPFPLPGTIPTHEVTPTTQWSSGPLQSGPVVLDLAGLAATGQPLELVIEPNTDGNGVRLRFAAPGTSGVTPTPIDLPAGTVVHEAPEGSVDVAEDSVEFQEDPAPSDEMLDVPFLTGGAVEAPVVEAPVVELPVTAPFVEESAPQEPSFLLEPAVEAEAPVAEAPQAPVFSERDFPVYAEETPETTEDPYGDDEDESFQEDSAKILADIRARLAELDARRHAHS